MLRFMGKIIQSPAGMELPSEGLPEFKLVIAYDDFANRRCAMRFSDRLIVDAGNHLEFVPIYLKFEDLLWPHIGSRVAREVEQADMAVIAADGEADLPALVTDWLDTWGPNKKAPGSVLVALLSTAAGLNSSGRSVQFYLRQIARRSGMRFVCQQFYGLKNDAKIPLDACLLNDTGSDEIHSGAHFPSYAWHKAK